LGLKGEGFVDGKTLKIEYRWAAGHDERLPPMAVELVNKIVGLKFNSKPYGACRFVTWLKKLAISDSRAYTGAIIGHPAEAAGG